MLLFLSLFTKCFYARHRLSPRVMLCCLSTNTSLPLSLSLSVSLCPPSQLISSDADGAIQRAGRFRVENGSSDEVTRKARHSGVFAATYLRETESASVFFSVVGKQTSDYTPGTWRRTDVHLENPEYHTRWFFKYFLGKGQCVHVRGRGLNAARGSPRDEHPLAVEIKVSSTCVAFLLWFTELISRSQVGQIGRPSAPCSHMPTESLVHTLILLESPWRMIKLDTKTDTVLDTLLGASFKGLTSLYLPSMFRGCVRPGANISQPYVQGVGSPRCYTADICMSQP